MPYKTATDRRRYDRKWYKRNKELKKKRNNIYRKKHPFKTKQHKLKTRIFVTEYKKNHPCKCGESDHLCLDFHHIYKKEFAISKMVSDGASVWKVMKEMEKCEILCANCHRKLGPHG